MENILNPDTVSDMTNRLKYCCHCKLQVDESKVEDKDIELVMQQANVSRSKVS